MKLHTLLLPLAAAASSDQSTTLRKECINLFFPDNSQNPVGVLNLCNELTEFFDDTNKEENKIIGLFSNQKDIWMLNSLINA